MREHGQGAHPQHHEEAQGDEPDGSRLQAEGRGQLDHDIPAGGRAKVVGAPVVTPVRLRALISGQMLQPFSVTDRAGAEICEYLRAASAQARP